MTDNAKAPAAQPTTRRDEILQVAAQVIAERGLAGATVRDIGQAAGILSGSLYHHFDSKEQIVLDLLEESVRKTLAASQAIVERAPTATAALAELIHDSIHETASHPFESLILRNETRAFAETETLAPLAELRKASVALWTDVVRRGIESGEFRPELDPDVTVMAIIDGVIGVARWFGPRESRDVDQVTGTLVNVYLEGITTR